MLIADEPTTALDVTVQAEILKLIRDLKDRFDSGIVLITHDMGVVADMADRVLVMNDGRIVEQGPTRQIFNDPQHPYTQQLLAAVPHFGTHSPETAASGTPAPAATPQEAAAPAATPQEAAAPGAAVESVLELTNLVLEYPKRGSQPVFRAIDDVSFSVGKGEIVGLVGESGSGKTTIGRAAVGLLPIHSGSLKVAGVEMAGVKPK